MAKIKFRTALSALKKGGKACYQCVPVFENKVTEAKFLAEVAKITGESSARARLWLDAFGMVARKCNLDARPFNLGFMRGSLAILGRRHREARRPSRSREDGLRPGGRRHRGDRGITAVAE